MSDKRQLTALAHLRWSYICHHFYVTCRWTVIWCACAFYGYVGISVVSEIYVAKYSVLMPDCSYPKCL